MKDNGCGQSQDDIRLQLWIKMYDECQSQRRHHETARANLSITKEFLRPNVPLGGQHSQKNKFCPARLVF